VAYLFVQIETQMMGVEVDFVAADPLGDCFPVAGDDVVLLINNNTDTDQTATILGQQPASAAPVAPDYTIFLPARRTIKTPCIPAWRFGFRLWPLATIQYSDATGISVAAIRQGIL